MTVGLLSFAPVYLNGVLALLCVFVLPGLAFVRAIDVPNFPQRLLVIFLGSLTANHFLVVLIATLGLDPLRTYRFFALLLVITLVSLAIWDVFSPKARFKIRHNASNIGQSELEWLALSLGIICLAYFEVWERGVPNIFPEGDVSISWNRWALIWGHGLFPTGSYGYPQFIPTIWAVTYIFTGSVEHYFASYIYVVLLIVPLVLVSTSLRHDGWLPALLPLATFVWFILEIRDPWLRGSLQSGYPDWTAAVAGLCGVTLFVTIEPIGKDQAVASLAGLMLILLAAATKPIYGLFAVAILIKLCLDGSRLLVGRDRSWFLAFAIGLFAIFTFCYLVYFLHLTVRSMPGDSVSDLSDRLARAARVFEASFTPPFRLLVLSGLAVSPFLRRIRWLAPPIIIGTASWASTASYDLRNLFGVILVCAFISLFAVARLAIATRVISERHWRLPDGMVAACLVAGTLVLTLPLAQDDNSLRQRFNNQQFRIGAGNELNSKLEGILERGCFLLTGADYIYTIDAFSKYLPQFEFFHASLALPEGTIRRFQDQKTCTAILYPPERSLASVADFVKAESVERRYVLVGAANGWELLSAP